MIIDLTLKKFETLVICISHDLCSWRHPRTRWIRFRRDLYAGVYSDTEKRKPRNKKLATKAKKHLYYNVSSY